MKAEDCEKLLDWYDHNKRELPWRNTSDPYLIWLSEVILQQTRIDQGMAYFNRFAERYPCVQDLAQAPEDEVLKLWQGLGYYSRASNMHRSAKTIVNEYNGVFPSTYKEIRKLKGIGPYTAAAIASIAFNQPYPVMDGNVMRMISRLYALREAVNNTPGKKAIERILKKILPPKHPGKFNQAMMEFGALQCTPKNPGCSTCILKDQCMALRKNMVSQLPVKVKKKAPVKRFFHYLFIRHIRNGKPKVYLKKRTGKDIWQGLYEFPVIETKTALSPELVIKSRDWKTLFQNHPARVVRILESYRHQLTHRTIIAGFFEIEISGGQLLKSPGILALDEDEIFDFPVPRLIDLFLNKQYNRP